MCPVSTSHTPQVSGLPPTGTCPGVRASSTALRILEQRPMVVELFRCDPNDLPSHLPAGKS